MALLANKARTFFSELSHSTLDLVDAFYSDDAHFCDPIVDMRGVDKIRNYYRGLYQAVQEIRFEFGEAVEDSSSVALPWLMHLRAAKLKGGAPITVAGISHLTFDEVSNKATYHRDYFDMGAFVYEHVPLLGSAVKFAKSRLAPS